MAKKEKKAAFDNVVKDRKLPILTLDARWHEIFTEDQKTPEIKELEKKLNNLLKKQGKMVNDVKDLKKLKSSLLKEIMENMEVNTGIAGKEKDKKLIKNKQMINEINGRISQEMDQLGDVPYQIKEANEELMAESIRVFYARIEENKKELNEVAEWINRVRGELMHKILLKQDLEAENSRIYTYMHDILGAEAMEQFDNNNVNKEFS